MEFQECPNWLQSYCLNFWISVDVMGILLAVSQNFKKRVCDAETWKDLHVDLTRLYVPKRFYYESRAMLKNVDRVVTTYMQSWFAAQLGCPLWTSWVALPPWNRGQGPLYLNLVPDPPRMLSVDPVARKVKMHLHWTGDLLFFQIGLTNATSLSQLDSSITSSNPKMPLRTFSLIFFMLPRSTVRQAGPWFVNGVPCGIDYPVDIQPSIIHSRRSTHEISLTLKWTRARMSVYTDGRFLASRGFGPAYSHHYLDTHMKLFVDIVPIQNLVACVTPGETYQGKGGLHCNNALCHLCRIDHLLAHEECIHCHRLYCKTHKGFCPCLFEGCLLCLAEHMCPLETEEQHLL